MVFCFCRAATRGNLVGSLNRGAEIAPQTQFRLHQINTRSRPFERKNLPLRTTGCTKEHRFLTCAISRTRASPSASPFLAMGLIRTAMTPVTGPLKWAARKATKQAILVGILVSLPGLWYSYSVRVVRPRFVDSARDVSAIPPPRAHTAATDSPPSPNVPRRARRAWTRRASRTPSPSAPRA